MGKKSKRNKNKGKGQTGQQKIIQTNLHLPTQNQEQCVITDDLLDAILSRGVYAEESLNDKNKLRKYLQSLFASTKLHHVYFPLLEGLTKGAPRINNIRIDLFPGESAEPFPLLFLVCKIF